MTASWIVHGWEGLGSVRSTCGLFAVDTTIVRLSGEIDQGVRVVKSAMNEWEERNNDAKEEVPEFETNTYFTYLIL